MIAPTKNQLKTHNNDSNRNIINLYLNNLTPMRGKTKRKCITINTTYLLLNIRSNRSRGRATICTTEWNEKKTSVFFFVAKRIDRSRVPIQFASGAAVERNSSVPRAPASVFMNYITLPQCVVYKKIKFVLYAKTIKN